MQRHWGRRKHGVRAPKEASIAWPAGVRKGDSGQGHRAWIAFRQGVCEMVYLLEGMCVDNDR